MPTRSLPLQRAFLLVSLAAVPGAQSPKERPSEFERSDRAGTVHVRVKETLIGFNEPGTVPGLFIIDPSGSRFAYGVMAGGGISVVVDQEKGELYEGIAEGSIRFSPDGKHLAYVGTRPTGHYLVFDGKAYQYHGVSAQGVVFSPQGDRYAWVAVRDRAQIAVIDGVESPPYSGVGPPGILFSSDGKRTAYSAATGDKALVVLDGEEGELFDQVGGLRFSPDGRFALYVGQREGKSYAVVNTTAYGPYDSIRSTNGEKPAEDEVPQLFEISADGSRFGFIASRDGQWYVNVDGQEFGPFKGCAGLAISPEGSRVAYLATRGEGWLLVIDGEEQPGLTIKTLSFSPDGKHLGSVIRKGNEFLAVIDGVEGKPYDRIEEPGIRFSPVGDHTAYVATLGDESFVVKDGVEGPRFKRLGKIALGFVPNTSKTLYSVRRKDKEALVIDGVEGPSLDSLRSLTFTADGSRHAYAGELGKDRWIAIVDGQSYGPGGRLAEGEDRAYESMGKHTPIFSPDGKHVAWTAVSERGCLVVVDGVESHPYNFVMRSTLGFSPDSQHMAFAAERNGTKYVVIDGLEIDNAWDGFLSGSEILWKGSKACSLRGTRDPKYFLIDFEIL